jgi:hypothetical protein
VKLKDRIISGPNPLLLITIWLMAETTYKKLLETNIVKD